MLHSIRRFAFPVVIVLTALAIGVGGFAIAQLSGTSSQNCGLVRGLAHIESEFIRTDAIDRKGALTEQERTQDIKAFSKIIAADSLLKQSRAQQALDNQTITYWRDVLVRRAQAIVVAAHCQ